MGKKNRTRAPAPTDGTGSPVAQPEGTEADTLADDASGVDGGADEALSPDGADDAPDVAAPDAPAVDASGVDGGALSWFRVVGPGAVSAGHRWHYPGHRLQLGSVDAESVAHAIEPCEPPEPDPAPETPPEG